MEAASRKPVQPPGLEALRKEREERVRVRSLPQSPRYSLRMKGLCRATERCAGVSVWRRNVQAVAGGRVPAGKKVVGLAQCFDLLPGGRGPRPHGLPRLHAADVAFPPS